ncbi:MAG TPA: carboxypeptidase-like regulatory domain-containing protein [Candidatus Sulfotelmatobacter sp.]|nr:carboxypeptidase-like regulatory domain-containing protein [Candidatus Sulfotelmatobacter sp.]
MRLRQFGASFGTWAILLGLSLPVCATERPGAISGYVRNMSGDPQMGAIIEVLGAANHTLTVFSNGAGFYAATGLLPGVYTLKVSAPSFLAASREKIGVRSGASVHVNVTLNTLLDVMQLGPAQPLPDTDDWKWTLRAVSNRPVLRIFDDPASVEKPDHELKGTLSFLAGSAAGGYGTGSDVTTGFTLERSIFADSRLNFSGNIGYGNTIPAAVVRARYTHQLPDGSSPYLALTARRFSPADPNLHSASLQALALSAGDELTLGDALDVKVGSELQTIQFLGHVTAFRPFGSADLHLSPNTFVEYAYTTSRPDPRAEKGFDSAPADLSESDPRVSLANNAPQVERAHHQEVSVSHRAGNNSMQVAMFSDRVGNTALTGAGEVTSEGGFLLPDIASGTFSYTGGNLDTTGMRIVLQRKFSSDLTATFDYAFGGVLELAHSDVALATAQQSITTQRRHALAAKLSGKVAKSHTQWIASYGWESGSAVTPVDMFNSSPGHSDPYLNVFIRQPIPTMGFLPGHMEALIDVRNLLAQGYVPVLGQDGQTVYLVQSARSVRGGVAFTF